jgi:hypothetical protein
MEDTERAAVLIPSANPLSLTADTTTTLESKVNTALAALDRVLVASSSSSSKRAPEKQTGIFTVYFLGSDESELLELSEEWISTYYMRFISYAFDRGFRTLRMLFVGPNLNPLFDDEKLSFAGLVPPGTSVEVLVFTKYYHDVESLIRSRWSRTDEEIGEEVVTPDIVLMMNAGIWGYESWKSTLKALSQFKNEKLCYSGDLDSSSGRSIFLVTSYTLAEAEEDFDCIQALFPCSENDNRVNWFWECELNPMRSQVPLSRHAPTRKSVAGQSVDPVLNSTYMDNHYWSCFEFVQNS